MTTETGTESETESETPMPISRARTRADTVTVVELFDIELPGGTVLRLTGHGATAIGFNDESYTVLPIDATGFAWSGQGNPARPELRVGNSGNLFGRHFKNPYMVGSRVKRIVTFLEECDAPLGSGGGGCFTPECWQVERVTRLDAEEVTLTLMPEASLDGASLPLKVMLKDLCQHRYRIWDADNNRFDYDGATCPYRGSAGFDENGASTSNANDKCSLRLETGCKKRFSGTLPFLGFPGMGGFR